MHIADPQHLLPGSPDEAEYWRALHARPLAHWLPALEHIRARHNLPLGEWSRFSLGRNLVFGDAQLVLKLAPPFWAGDLAAEGETLRYVAGRLPLATPSVIAQGMLEGWEYLVQNRLPGEPLRFYWADLSARSRAALAYRQGQIMAALHALPADAAPPRLSFPWAAMLDEQRADCRRELQRAGVPAPLLSDLDTYLEPVWPLLSNTEQRLLHGDLDAINLLVEPTDSGLHFSGLVDWGDAKLGPAAHELISPGVHTLVGDRPSLEAWYSGYGLDVERRAAIEHEVMARSILYYAGELHEYLGRVPGALECRRWSDVARLFWSPRIHANRG